MKHIKFYISDAKINDGKLSNVSIHSIIDSEGDAYQADGHKYLQDIIAHALSLTKGIEIESNKRFTYSFPFKLA